jgi:hypothetical protein
MSFDRERRPADCAAFEAVLADIMKRNGLTASDKDIARWVAAEVAQLPAQVAGGDATLATPA